MSEAALTIEHLSKSYSRGWRKEPMKAVNDLSLSIQKGSVVGLIGPNGAGKTTAIYCILGLLIPDEGSISIFGHSPGEKEARKRIGYQLEIFHSYDFLRPAQVLSLYGTLSGLSRAEVRAGTGEQLDRLGLGNARHQKIGSFSKGMKQRLGVAQALLHDPDLLILDEPFTGLDPQGRKQIADIVLAEKDRGKTIFFSSHVLSDIERLCDEVIMIRKGEVVLSGTLRDITTGDDRWIVRVAGWREEYEKEFKSIPITIESHEDATELTCSQEHKNRVIRTVLDLDADILDMRVRSRSLEDLYMELDQSEPGVQEDSLT